MHLFGTLGALLFVAQRRQQVVNVPNVAELVVRGHLSRSAVHFVRLLVHFDELGIDRVVVGRHFVAAWLIFLRTVAVVVFDGLFINFLFSLFFCFLFFLFG